MKFHPSGICTLNVTKETFSIVDTEHPEECYMDKLQMLCRRRADAFLWEKGVASVTVRNISMKVMLEDLDRGDGRTRTGGFALYIGRNIVTSETLILEFLFVRKETMEKAYRYEYPYCIKWS